MEEDETPIAETSSATGSLDASLSGPVFGYFIVPQEMHKLPPSAAVSVPPSPTMSKKRGPDDSDAQDRTPKVVRSLATFAQDAAAVEPGWTGPYGI